MLSGIKGNIRPHMLQIKLCRIYFGLISDKICGQIRLLVKNLDSMMMLVLGGQAGLNLDFAISAFMEGRKKYFQPAT